MPKTNASDKVIACARLLRLGVTPIRVAIILAALREYDTEGE